MPLLSLPLAFISGLHVGLIFGLAGMAFAALFGVLGMYFHHRKQALWHETARLALEKGQPIPEPPSSGDASWYAGGDRGGRVPTPEELKTMRELQFSERWRGYLIGGLCCVAVGAGLYLFIGIVGAIPGFVGIALLIGAAIEGLAARKSGR